MANLKKTLWILIFFLLILHDNMKRPPFLAIIFGTGFGSGFWPWGPGTAGTLLAILIWLGLSVLLPPSILLVALLLLIVAFTAIGTWAANQLEPFWGKDPHRVVIDEMVGAWIPLVVVSPDKFWYVLAAFVLFRFFDIVKPLGIRSLDRRTGGFWVMADDILAGIYSLIFILLIQWVL